MGITQPKRVRRVTAALGLVTGLTLFGGLTAQAETVDASNNTTSSVVSHAPTDVTASATMGPFFAQWLCNFHKNNVGPTGGACYKSGGSWYYDALP